MGPSHALAQQARLQRRRDGADARQLHAARADAPADLRLRAARRAPRADGEPVRQLRPSSPPAPARRWNARGGISAHRGSDDEQQLWPRHPRRCGLKMARASMRADTRCYLGSHSDGALLVPVPHTICAGSARRETRASLSSVLCIHTNAKASDLGRAWLEVARMAEEARLWLWFH